MLSKHKLASRSVKLIMIHKNTNEYTDIVPLYKTDFMYVLNTFFLEFPRVLKFSKIVNVTASIKNKI